MESRKFSLVLFSVTFVAALFEISSGYEDLPRKKFDAKEMIVLANQVRYIILYFLLLKYAFSSGKLSFSVLFWEVSSNI